MNAGGTRSKSRLSTLSGKSSCPLAMPRKRPSGLPRAKSASSLAPPGPTTVVSVHASPVVRCRAAEVAEEFETR
ncbi:Uncharacterised protein [Mycobacteroides abscessus subsp. abscessus]|nr:Uncharacterised protein [Mycobacteroides abscessus subsp. abscessus]